MNQKTKKTPERALRIRLEKDLGQKLSEPIWENLVTHKWVRRAISNDREYLDLKGEAHKLLDLVEASRKERKSEFLPEKRQRRAKSGLAHQHAASYFLAD